MKKVGGSSKRQLVLDEVVDPAEYGRVVDLATFSTGGQELLCYATSMGKLCGLDLRSSTPAWELTNDAKFGECVIMPDHRLCLGDYKKWDYQDVKYGEIVVSVSACRYQYIVQ